MKLIAQASDTTTREEIERARAKVARSLRLNIPTPPSGLVVCPAGIINALSAERSSNEKQTTTDRGRHTFDSARQFTAYPRYDDFNFIAASQLKHIRISNTL